MKLDVMEILDHFCLDDGQLYRKRLDGTVRPVRLVERGRVVSMLNGRRVFGPEIAWCIYYGVAPLYPVVHLSENPHKLGEIHLVCARLKRLRYALVESSTGFTHPLSQLPFATAQQCRSDWESRARRYYAADMPFIMAQQDEAKALSAGSERPPRGRKPPKPRKPVSAASKPPKERPEPVQGRQWKWYKDAWISLPDAVHPSDDWMVRAEAVLRNPEATFYYDTVLQRTLEAPSS
jgi:hypothetical protein